MSPARSAATGLWVGALLCLTVLPTAGNAAAEAPGETQAESPQYITIVVQRGDTLYQIARRYGITVNAIVQANGLRDPNALRVGQTLRIPLPAGTPATAPPPNQRAGSSPANGYLWPVQGPIMSGFGSRDGRHHAGIDISAPSGTPILAARAGVVTHAGVYYEYGLTLIIEHRGGVSTVYGHTSALLARIGQTVQAGEMVARVGCSGRCTGPHVHFEVRVNGRAVNPMTVLGAPAQAAAQRVPPNPPASRPRPSPPPPPVPPTDRMELERTSRGGVTIIRYVSLTDDAVILTEDTLLSDRLVARTEEIITRREEQRVRITKVYAAQNGVLTLMAENTVPMDAGVVVEETAPPETPP